MPLDLIATAVSPVLWLVLTFQLIATLTGCVLGSVVMPRLHHTLPSPATVLGAISRIENVVRSIDGEAEPVLRVFRFELLNRPDSEALFDAQIALEKLGVAPVQDPDDSDYLTMRTRNSEIGPGEILEILTDFGVHATLCMIETDMAGKNSEVHVKLRW